jgi:hypothetical protein
VDTNVLGSVEVSEAGCWRMVGIRSSSVWNLTALCRGNISVRFLGGKMGWAKRDVEERKACAEEVQGVLMFTIWIDGWPFHTS